MEEATLAMDVREQFETDEFFRYAAECRRMARLTRRENLSAAPNDLAAQLLHCAKWIRQGLMLASEAMRNSAIAVLNQRPSGVRTPNQASRI
jgi:hypothetical protein